MGRETVAVCRWRGQVAKAKVLLEATELILRGGLRARFPRAAIADVATLEEGVTLSVAGERLTIEMAGGDAERWAKALATAPPSLAAKLGVDHDARAFVLGAVDDDALAKALDGATAAAPADAAVIVAVVEDEAGVAAAASLARQADRPLWCVHGKGRHATIADAAIRALLRADGFVDTKSCAVSDRLTATRYRFRA